MWAGADVIEPDHTLALVALSRGGSTPPWCASSTRTKSFVPDGFILPEAKSRLAWEDHDTVLVGTDFGPDSLTESGYPRIVKRWKRGEPLEQATMLFTGSVTDAAVTAGWTGPRVPTHPDLPRGGLLQRSGLPASPRGTGAHRRPLPTDASLSVHRDWLLIELRTDRHRLTPQEQAR